MQDVDGYRIVIVPDIFKVKAMVDQAGLAYTPLSHKDNIFLVLNALEKLLCLRLSIAKELRRDSVCQEEWICFHIANIVIIRITLFILHNVIFSCLMLEKGQT